MARILVAGTVRVPHENLNGLRPHIETYIAACRAEDGCETFSFAEDLLEPGLIRVFEVWRDGASLDRHKGAAHVAAWRAAWADYGVHARTLMRFEIADAQPF
jgi:quinol monooxygenase YgiN